MTIASEPKYLMKVFALGSAQKNNLVPKIVPTNLYKPVST